MRAKYVLPQTRGGLPLYADEGIAHNREATIYSLQIISLLVLIIAKQDELIAKLQRDTPNLVATKNIAKQAAMEAIQQWKPQSDT